jgi:hypothetical protein
MENGWFQSWTKVHTTAPLRFPRINEWEMPFKPVVKHFQALSIQFG